MQEVYTGKARELEAKGKLREAENLYCSIKQYDSAIELYKLHSMWDHVIRLVSQHRKVRIRGSLQAGHAHTGAGLVAIKLTQYALTAVRQL